MGMLYIFIKLEIEEKLKRFFNLTEVRIKYFKEWELYLIIFK